MKSLTAITLDTSVHIEPNNLYSTHEVVSSTRILEQLDGQTVLIIYFDNVTVEAADAKKDCELYREFTNGLPQKRLIIAGNFTKLSEGAKKCLKDKKLLMEQNIVAEAIVVNSIAQQLMANFYYTLTKQNYPMKVFSNIESAKKWLAGFTL